VSQTVRAYGLNYMHLLWVIPSLTDSHQSYYNFESTRILASVYELINHISVFFKFILRGMSVFFD